VINIGQVYLRYGHQPTARLTSQPMLCYREEDLYLRDGARRIPIEGNYLSARRDVDEGLALADLAEEYLDGSLPAVALQDGTLVRWTLAGAERVVQDYFLSRYLSYLDRMRHLGIPVASYISRPRSPEVIGTIRLMHCPDVIIASERGAHTVSSVVTCALGVHHPAHPARIWLMAISWGATWLRGSVAPSSSP
jgi:hypothetical protein